MQEIQVWDLQCCVSFSCMARWFSCVCVYTHVYMHVCVCIHTCICMCVYIYICVLYNSRSCLTLCNPLDCSPPGSSVRGIFQTRIQELVAIFSSRASSWPKDRTCVSFGSCIASEFFTCWAMGEAPCLSLCGVYGSGCTGGLFEPSEHLW